LKLPDEDSGSDDIPLGPVDCWPEEAQPVADLFPRQHILSDEYHAALPESSVWEDESDRFALCVVQLTTPDVSADIVREQCFYLSGSPRSIVTIAATLQDRLHQRPSRRGRLDRSACRGWRVRNMAS